MTTTEGSGWSMTRRSAVVEEQRGRDCHPKHSLQPNQGNTTRHDERALSKTPQKDHDWVREHWASTLITAFAGSRPDSIGGAGKSNESLAGATADRMRRQAHDLTCFSRFADHHLLGPSPSTIHTGPSVPSGHQATNRAAAVYVTSVASRVR
jgi:hypothetical protein